MFKIVQKKGAEYYYWSFVVKTRYKIFSLIDYNWTQLNLTSFDGVRRRETKRELCFWHRNLVISFRLTPVKL